MALPTSAPITLVDLATEYGDTAPHQLSEFYGEKSYAPTSGEIMLGGFLGGYDGAPVTINVTISSDVEAYNLYNEVSSQLGSGYNYINVTIDAGVTIGGYVIGGVQYPAFTISGFNGYKDLITITNNGLILGGGGDGGDGAYSIDNGSGGGAVQTHTIATAGGEAIFATSLFSLVNNGTIAGGGGGGGGGRGLIIYAQDAVYGAVLLGGGGGGGGAGAISSTKSGTGFGGTAGANDPVAGTTVGGYTISSNADGTDSSGIAVGTGGVRAGWNGYYSGNGGPGGAYGAAGIGGAGQTTPKNGAYNSAYVTGSGTAGASAGYWINGYGYLRSYSNNGTTYGNYLA
jgi:hypothetical protein